MARIKCMVPIEVWVNCMTLQENSGFTTKIISRKFTSRLRRRYDEKKFRRKADVILQRIRFIVNAL